MAEDAAHGKTRIAFHLRKIIKQKSEVVDVQAEYIGIFEGIDIVYICCSLHETTRRIYPLTFTAEVFGNFFPVFQKIRAQESLLYKVTFGADRICIVNEFSLLKSFKSNPAG